MAWVGFGGLSLVYAIADRFVQNGSSARFCLQQGVQQADVDATSSPEKEGAGDVVRGDGRRALPEAALSQGFRGQQGTLVHGL